MSVNKAIIIGNLGKDPEIKNSQDGKEIAFFSVATSEHWKDKASGEKKEKTEWHRVAVFSQGLVGVVKSYLKKGSKVYVEGQIQTRKWTDKEGVERYLTEIVLSGFHGVLQLLDRKEEKDEKFNGKEFVAEAKARQSSVEVEVHETDDEIPF